MPGLGQTVSELMFKRMRDAAIPTAAATGDVAIRSVPPTGSNPGHLKMWALVPPGLPPGAPLVVVLHGCTQNAAGYDHGSGWSELARRHGFALLFPEQQSANNMNGCFNWFQPDDTGRDHGEVASIAQMIQQMVAQQGLNPARVYITGLSAGGAMAAAMLATYPELFAGGAVIAGLPFGAAGSMQAAMEAMRHVRSRTAPAWGDVVRSASSFRGRRPPVQIWHGSTDSTVRATSLDESAKQWCDAAAIITPPQTDQIDGATRQTWCHADGQVAVQTYLIPGLGHGVPLHSQALDLDESVGAPGAYMLETGIGSTKRIAHAWGLLTQAPRPRSSRPRSNGPGPSAGGVLDMNAVMQGALRRAGLAS